MDWVMIISLQWVVGASPTSPTTTYVPNFQTEQLCKAAADVVRAETSTSIGPGVQTYSRVVCMLRKTKAAKESD